MERGSNKHSPRVDDQLESEVRGTLHGTAGARAEEWRVAEPPGEDRPEITLEPPGVGNAEADQLSRFGRYIGKSALPGEREALERSARDLKAPDDVLEALHRLPPRTTYRTVIEVWKAVRA